ncbi:MAG: T9SS type A sorting domain-containing protein [Ignavibacteriaceae bacterium]
MSQWYGIYLNFDNTRVNWIFLDENNLNGTIPTDIQNLTALTVLDLSDNNLTGEIPKEIGDLSNIIELYLHRNKLNGPIPQELGKLSNLTHLWLYSNELEKEIPKELGNLSSLLYLWLDNNKLTGTIPSDLGKLINLKELTLYKNNLSGIISAEFRKLKNLQVLWLQNNELDGNIPPELGELVKLENLSLSNNKLDGAIPSEFGNLTELIELYLYNNTLLNGSIPTSLGNLSKLKKLYIFNTNIDGVIPPELGMLEKLEIMQLSGNNLIGQIPSTFGDLDSLQSLWLFGNQLDQTIPPTIGKLKKLKHLSLYSNKLTGSIPAELGDLLNLEGLFLDFNLLNGFIPDELSKLQNLTELDLSVNELDGPIPLALGSLKNLVELHLYENALTDTIPYEIGNLSKLKILSLGRNKLNDSKSLADLQSALLKLTELEWFLADRNEFTKFPDLSTLINLDTLEIQNNRLHFDSIEPNVGIKNFKYTPQDSLGKTKEPPVTMGSDILLALGFPVRGSNNQYQWYQGTEPIVGATSETYTIIQADYKHTGHYVLHVTNTVAKECTLYSRPITVKIPEEINLKQGTATEVECFTLGLKIKADVEYTGKVKVLFFNSEPRPGLLPEGSLKIAKAYFNFEADTYLKFSNAKIMIPLKELKDRGIDPNKIKWLRRPESGTGEWIDLEGEIDGNYFVSKKPFDSFSEFTFGFTEITDINEESYQPNEYRLYQNYPNPFNPTTKIEFRIADFVFVTLKVYNVLGEEIEMIVNEVKSAGKYEVMWNAKNLVSGVYFYKIQAGDFIQVKKMILLK